MKKSVALILVLTLTLTVAAAQAEAAGRFIPGEYAGRGDGFGGPVSVAVTVDENSVIKVTAAAGNETPSVGGAAIETLCANAVEANGSYYVIVDENYFADLKENGFRRVDFMVGNRDFSSPFSAYNSNTERLVTPPRYFLAEGDPITEMDEIIRHGTDAGVVFEGATVEELAEKIHAPELAAAVEKYNEAAAAGADDEFGKDVSMMRSIGANGEKVYAVKAKGFCFTTSGGLNVNSNIEVLDVEGNVMPGLYACGTDSMGVLFSEESGYMDYGGADHGWCFVSGKIAGKNAAEFAKK